MSESASPRFDPAGLRGIYAVQEWSPGREVRFARPLRVGRMAFTAAIAAGGYLSGPVWFVLHRSSLDLLGQFLEAGVIGAMGGMIGTFVAVESALATPRAVFFDWTTRSFRRDGTGRGVATSAAADRVELTPLRPMELRKRR